MTLPVANSIGSNTGGTKWRRLDQSLVIMLYNATKSWLLVKEEHAAWAAELFQGIDVQITTEGKRHLGAALGPRTFVETYVTGMVQEWVREVEQLAAIASSQLHAACCYDTWPFQ